VLGAYTHSSCTVFLHDDKITTKRRNTNNKRIATR
jgi:hypothetical protein